MGNEESTLADDLESDDNEHGLTIKIKPRSQPSMDSKVTAAAEELPVTPSAPKERKKRPLPRQAGYCRNSWTCCKCKYLNKTGKWSTCQNPTCRHQRCAACKPKNLAIHAAAEYITDRRWPADGLCFEDKIVQLGLCKSLAVAGMHKEVDAVRSAKEAEIKVERDLWGRRIGAWPGGF